MYVPRVAYGGQRITLGPQIPPCLEQDLLLVTATYNRLAGPGASGILLSPLTHWHIRHTVQTHNTAPGTPCRHTLTAAPGTLCRHTLPHQAHCTDTGCHTRAYREDTHSLLHQAHHADTHCCIRHAPRCWGLKLKPSCLHQALFSRSCEPSTEPGHIQISQM